MVGGGWEEQEQRAEVERKANAITLRQRHTATTSVANIQPITATGEFGADWHAYIIQGQCNRLELT